MVESSNFVLFLYLYTFLELFGTIVFLTSAYHSSWSSLSATPTMVSLTQSSSAIQAFLLFSVTISGPLYLWFPLPGTLFLQLLIWLAHISPSRSSIPFSLKPSLIFNVKLEPHSFTVFLIYLPCSILIHSIFHHETYFTYFVYICLSQLKYKFHKGSDKGSSGGWWWLIFVFPVTGKMQNVWCKWSSINVMLGKINKGCWMIISPFLFLFNSFKHNW